MSQLVLSPRKAASISNGVFLISLGILFFTNLWWPGILLALWATLGLRQYLVARYWDFALTSIIFIGLFVLNYLDWDILLPVLFVVAGIFLIVREYFFGGDTNGEEKSKEIEEDVKLD